MFVPVEASGRTIFLSGVKAVDQHKNIAQKKEIQTEEINNPELIQDEKEQNSPITDVEEKVIEDSPAERTPDKKDSKEATEDE